MNYNISCEIVQDLLPNYIENIVSNETKDLVSKHLNTCDCCRKEIENMSAQLNLAPAHEKKIDYLKGIHKKSRNILIACMVLCFASFLISDFLSEPNFDEFILTMIFYIFAASIILIYAIPLLGSIIGIFLYRKSRKNWLLFMTAIFICIFVFLIIGIYNKSKYGL